MDFSNFSETQVNVEENTHILVIDFVNRSCLFSEKVNNFEPIDPEFVNNFENAVLASITSYKNRSNVEKSKKAA